jgi:hypothetical protein
MPVAATVRLKLARSRGSAKGEQRTALGAMRIPDGEARLRTVAARVGLYANASIELAEINAVGH